LSQITAHKTKTTGYKDFFHFLGSSALKLEQWYYI
jgi:hypothetical protein